MACHRKVGSSSVRRTRSRRWCARLSGKNRSLRARRHVSKAEVLPRIFYVPEFASGPICAGTGLTLCHICTRDVARLARYAHVSASQDSARISLARRRTRSRRRLIWEGVPPYSLSIPSDAARHAFIAYVAFISRRRRRRFAASTASSAHSERYDSAPRRRPPHSLARRHVCGAVLPAAVIVKGRSRIPT